MLLSFGAKNFFCFKEGAEFSFELGPQCPKSISYGKPYSNVLCVKGANAAGKTNALKIISFLSLFCADSFNNKPDTEIHFESFFHNEDATSFYVEFSEGDTVYRYELDATISKVMAERIYRKKKRLTKIIERELDEITYTTNDFDDLKTIKKIRSNASIVSIANQHEIDCVAPIYKFFRRILTNVYYGGMISEDEDYHGVAKFYYENKDDFEFVKNVIGKFDLGVNNVEIVKRKNEDGSYRYFPYFIHVTTDGKKHDLPFFEESSGTQSLFKQLWRYKLALDFGGILVLDEFDIKLHPDILPKLIQMFLDPKVNKSNAQFLFTTHNADILDMLGKYRTVLVSKEDNECFAYRLDEIPGDILRNDRSIVNVYKSGRIGGVPKLG